jgi:hypothetical protein
VLELSYNPIEINVEVLVIIMDLNVPCPYLTTAEPIVEVEYELLLLPLEVVLSDEAKFEIERNPRIIMEIIVSVFFILVVSS